MKSFSLVLACLLFLLGLAGSSLSQQLRITTLGRIKDKPPSLAFVIVGKQAISGFVLKKGESYFIAVPSANLPASKFDEVILAVPPIMDKVANPAFTSEGNLALFPADEQRLQLEESKSANLVSADSRQVKDFLVPIVDEVNYEEGRQIEVSFRLLPVKPEGGGFRVLDFLYTKSVRKGTYPLFARLIDGEIAVAGLLQVKSNDKALFLETGI